MASVIQDLLEKRIGVNDAEVIVGASGRILKATELYYRFGGEMPGQGRAMQGKVLFDEME